MIKRIFIFLLSLLVLLACQDKRLPEGIIGEQKMVNVLADLTIIDGYMSSLMYTDTLRAQGKNFYATVYRNHRISKAVFDSSMRYYSKQPVLLDSMYSKVDKILAAKEKRLLKKQELEQKKLTQSK